MYEEIFEIWKEKGHTVGSGLGKQVLTVGENKDGLL